MVKVTCVHGKVPGEPGQRWWNGPRKIQTARVGIPQRLEQHAIDNREHGCSRAESQRECKYSDRGETGTALHLAKCVLQVAAEAIDSRPAPHLPSDLFDQQFIAQLPARAQFRFGQVLTAFGADPRGHCEMRLNLLIEFRVTPPAAAPPRPEVHAVTPHLPEASSS